jgi:glutathione S-transferase
MELYYFETPNPRKACAVARYLGSPVEFIRIDLTKGENKAPDFLAINPNGKVPTLKDGDTALWESAAIMAYLAQKAGSELWPSDPSRQIDALRWLQWDAWHFSRHGQTLLFENAIKPKFNLGEPDTKAIDEAMVFWRRFAAVLDQHLKGRDSIVGDGLTVADFAVGSILPTAEMAKIPLGEFPQITRWHDRLMQLPAWREPFPGDLAKSA